MEPLIRNARHINVGDGERYTSVIAGSALLLSGMQRRSLAGLALAVLGGSLVYRGATGRCGLYSLLGVNTAQANDHDRAPERPALTGEKLITATEAHQPAILRGQSSSRESGAR